MNIPLRSCSRALSLGLTLSLLAVPAGAQGVGVPFIDAHLHLNDPEAAVALMRSMEIPGAIVLRGGRATNEALFAAAARSSGRLIPFASISPEHREYRQRWEAGDTTLVTELDRMLEGGGFGGIGEISVVHFASEGFPEADYDPAGPIMQGILALADRRGLPVMIHCEVTRLREFSALLEAYPRVRVIWAHGGYTPLVLAARMLERHPNLIYELSARTWARHPRSPDYTIFRNDSAVWPEWISLIERYQDRVVVGTDASYRSPDNERRKIERVWLLLSHLSDETRTRVATGNLELILSPAH